MSGDKRIMHRLALLCETLYHANDYGPLIKPGDFEQVFLILKVFKRYAY